MSLEFEPPSDLGKGQGGMMRRGRRGKFRLDRPEREDVFRVGGSYTILIIRGARAIECSNCGNVSYNVNDIEQLYCGFCHQFHAERAIGAGGAA